MMVILWANSRVRIGERLRLTFPFQDPEELAKLAAIKNPIILGKSPAEAKVIEKGRLTERTEQLRGLITRQPVFVHKSPQK